MGHRITLRVSDTLTQQIAAAATQRSVGVSDIVREALTHFFDAPRAGPVFPRTTAARPSHTPKDCIATMLRHASPVVQAQVATEAQRCNLAPDAVVSAILYCWATLGAQLTEPFWHGLREALRHFFETYPRADHRPHTPEECAAVVLAHSPPAVQERMRLAQQRTKASLLRLLPGILEIWSDAGRNPGAWTPERNVDAEQGI
jgi:hypothetical protein